MGNTRRVAEAIAAGAREAAPDVEVSCSPAGDARSGDADLLFVGAPTHFFGVPRARTRRLWVDGQQKASWEHGGTDGCVGAHRGGRGRAGMARRPAHRRDTRATAFDTRRRGRRVWSPSARRDGRHWGGAALWRSPGWFG